MTDLARIAADLEAWLQEAALPLWLERGVSKDGGFVEKLDAEGLPTADPRRSRIHPRQVYCFVQASRSARIAMPGAWEATVARGWDAYERVYRRDDGFYGNLSDADGHLIDDTFDLYNQAFALLGMASMARGYPGRSKVMAAQAQDFLVALRAGYGHPDAGFEEARPPRTPLGANPHMHLFETAMEWETVAPDAAAPDAVKWSALADEIAGLCLSRFIDPRTGAVREFFDHDWHPMPGEVGRIVEPGHQFEWAWLLAHWAKRRGERPDALAAARRLFDLAETHGICAQRDVAMMALLDDFTVHDATARLWSQTEWLKSAVFLATLSDGSERTRYLASARRAAAAFQRFLDVPLQGLWRDRQMPDGSFVDEPSPASSFYHIVCAILELRTCLTLIERQPT
jgi:mannose/cellobiose epimerase-like protein (N-acyl-D-glucosamine 2-epimerase family)